MSDEAAFLDALAANPADDTARLVYADWLDEHGEPARAEYLRLVVALARAETDYAREQPDVARTLTLAETLPPEWRDEVERGFKLVFYGCEDVCRLLPTIKAIREVTGFSLYAAVKALENAPSELRDRVRLDEGLAARNKIRNSGGTVYLQPGECTAQFHDIIAVRYSAQSAKCETAFITFLRAAMDIGVEEAQQLAVNTRVTIARHLGFTTAAAKARELRELVEWEQIDDDFPETQPVGGLRVWAVPNIDSPEDVE